MNTRTHLALALEHATKIHAEIKSAHSAAIESGDQFAEIVLLSLLEDAARLGQKIERAHHAAKGTS